MIAFRLRLRIFHLIEATQQLLLAPDAPPLEMRRACFRYQGDKNSACQIKADLFFTPSPEISVVTDRAAVGRTLVSVHIELAKWPPFRLPFPKKWPTFSLPQTGQLLESGDLFPALLLVK
jgi:hypothetical protein